MIGENQEEARLLNTAIIKSKENLIDATFEKRLYETCHAGLRICYFSAL